MWKCDKKFNLQQNSVNTGLKQQIYTSPKNLTQMLFVMFVTFRMCDNVLCAVVEDECSVFSMQWEVSSVKWSKHSVLSLECRVKSAAWPGLCESEVIMALGSLTRWTTCSRLCHQVTSCRERHRRQAVSHLDVSLVDPGLQTGSPQSDCLHHPWWESQRRAESKEQRAGRQ